jgi:hypothetical protein
MGRTPNSVEDDGGGANYFENDRKAQQSAMGEIEFILAQRSARQQIVLRVPRALKGQYSSNEHGGGC